MVEVNKDLLAPCGLYCGACAIYIAHRDDNTKFKEKLIKVYAPFTKTVEDIQCTGCMSDGIVASFCQACAIKKCTARKGIEGCHQCEDFAGKWIECRKIKNFPIAVGKKVLLRALPEWRELGTEKWVEKEEERYHCPECGNSLFRGAKRCNKCKIPVNVD